MRGGSLLILRFVGQRSRSQLLKIEHQFDTFFVSAQYLKVQNYITRHCSSICSQLGFHTFGALLIFLLFMYVYLCTQIKCRFLYVYLFTQIKCRFLCLFMYTDKVPIFLCLFMYTVNVPIFIHLKLIIQFGITFDWLSEIF